MENDITVLQQDNLANFILVVDLGNLDMVNVVHFVEQQCVLNVDEIETEDEGEDDFIDDDDVEILQDETLRDCKDEEKMMRQSTTIIGNMTLILKMKIDCKHVLVL